MFTRLSRGFLAATLAFGLVIAQPVFASHATLDGNSATSVAAGATATYTIAYTPCCGTYGPVVAPGNGRIVLSFPAGYDLTGAAFNAAASGIRQTTTDPYSAFPGHTATVNAAARTVTISNINAPIDQDNTGFRLVVSGVRNPTSAGSFSVTEQTYDGATQFSGLGIPFNIIVPPGVDLDVPGDAALFASEIIAPATLVNTGGALNLNVPLGYNPSHEEVRYVRLECPGMQFANNTTVSYVGGGTASVGAVNGLSSSAIYFSFTADDNVSALDRLVIGGDRAITSTQRISCTYSLYDQPSQASFGGATGRIATLTGTYIDFGPSTVFTSVSNTSTANVEANPSYTAFLASGATTTTTAALARLTYSLASPTPLKLNGMPITLADLHATGASGTKIVVTGDFSGAADAGGSYTTGTALARVYLSSSSSSCSFGTPASTLSATTATFDVGATARDAMLCYAPLSGFAIPVGTYTAILDAVSAAPSVYRVDDLGPVAAGSIIRNGTQLQAPLAQLPTGYLSRIALTNTGTVARFYSIRVMSETGNVVSTNSANMTGTIPANGMKFFELNSVITGFSAGTRATIVLTVDAPSDQIQAVYQIVNPSNGTISNHVMVRPGTN